MSSGKFIRPAKCQFVGKGKPCGSDAVMNVAGGNYCPRHGRMRNATGLQVNSLITRFVELKGNPCVPSSSR